MGVVIKILQWLFMPWLTRKFKGLAAAYGKETAKPHFEVERKYPVSQEEFHKLPGRLRDLGFLRKSKATIVDTFLPAEKEGDMVRLREETTDGLTVTVITLKEWVEVAGQRERKERESDPIDAVTKDCMLSLGRRLASEPLMSFSKDRTTFSGHRDKRQVTVALDVASGLGDFSGTYLEVELIVERQEDVADARAFVESFVVELLGAERECAISYMEMLKRSRKQSSKN
jgi:adenylate cyclase class IV